MQDIQGLSIVIKPQFLDLEFVVAVQLQVVLAGLNVLITNVQNAQVIVNAS